MKLRVVKEEEKPEDLVAFARLSHKRAILRTNAAP